MELVIGVLAGGFLSWLITHLYYVRANRGQAELYGKLSADLREVILADKHDSLTIPELNELLQRATIESGTDDPLPYKACPKCGSQHLRRSEATDERRDQNYYIIECETCRWYEWTQ